MSKLDIKKEIEKSKVIEIALKKIDQDLKISSVDKQKDVPDFPQDVTSLSSELVGNYYATYEAEVAYIRAELAKVEAKLVFGRHILDKYRKSLYLSHRRDCSTADAWAWVDVDKDVGAAELEIIAMDTQQRLLMSRYEAYSKYASSMSREITRRKQDYDGDHSGGSKGSSQGKRNIPSKEPKMSYRKLLQND